MVYIHIYRHVHHIRTRVSAQQRKVNFSLNFSLNLRKSLIQGKKISLNKQKFKFKEKFINLEIFS